jgi:hypothetical protein
LKIVGLSLDKPAVFRPLSISVDVDTQSSDPTPLLLSSAQRNTPLAVAVAALLALGVVVFLLARGRAARYRPLVKRYPTLAFLFIEAPSNTFSLARAQLIVWTGAAILAGVYVATSQALVQGKWQLPAIPEGLVPLLGISAGTAALSIGHKENRGSKGAGPPDPGLGDFITIGGILAPDRLQFFLWTILGVVGFVGATLAQDPATITNPPKIPENFLSLMGVSSLGYLAGKVARKPGPIVQQLVPPPRYDPGAPPAQGIVVAGENLSPKAQVCINGVQVPPGSVTVPPDQPAAAEFVTKLAVSAEGVSAAGPPSAEAPSIKIVNPDGQSAEI